MTLGDRDMEMLASLKDMPAFVLLTQIMKNSENQILAEIAVIKTESELVRTTRFYQTLRWIREVLENKPQEAADAIEQAKTTAMYDQEVGARTDVFHRRFNPVSEMDQLAIDI